MQFKTLTPLFLASLALASPAPQNADSPDSYDIDMSDLLSFYDSVPSSILSVMETAIPSTWIEAMANPTAVSSVLDEIEHGTYPAWYSSLPENVKAWVTSAAMAEFSDEATATPTADSDSSSSDVSIKNTAAAGPVETASASSSTTHSGSHVTETPSSNSSSESASGSSSVAATSATSSPNAAPAATGAVAMGFAGVAGLLGVAFIL